MYKFSELGPLDHFFAKRILKQEYSEPRALFLSMLMNVSRQGHLCWIPGDDFQKIGSQLPSSIVEDGIGMASSAPVIRSEGRYYLQRNWVYETYLLEQIIRLKVHHISPFYDIEVFQSELRKTVQDGKLLPSQAKAIELAFETQFSLICGGPGTGKTYTAGFLVRLLLNSLKTKSYKVVLAAPTGKAASHLQSALLAQGDLSSALQLESTTLHRLLRLIPGENRLFSTRKIDADLVIVDEASMLDVPLLAALLEAIGSETKLVLMGDPDQLPPVEAGSLFAEIAALFAVRLERSMRTEISHLQDAAMLINQGKLPHFNHPSSELLSLPFDKTLGEKLFNSARPLISWQEPSPENCLKQLDQYRILGALRQGPFGTDELNRQIIQEMNRKIQPGQWWSLPIMITVNESRLDLYNGSCGVLIGKSRGGINFQEAKAYFPGKEPLSSLPPFEPAFCLSIHKSQGSEFEEVLALFPPGSENFGREALYTAVTRAKKGIKLVATEEILVQMLMQKSHRGSGFSSRIKKMLNL